MPAGGRPPAEGESALADLLARTTLELCAIPSVTGGEKDVADDVERRLSALAPFRLGNNLVVGRRGHRPAVGFFGHLDTVPPAPGDGPPRIEGDVVHGRGASDMKGGLAVMLSLAEWAAARRDRLAFDPVFVFYDREEGPYAQNGLGPLLEARPDLATLDFGLCLEPTDNRIETGCCGSLQATLVFEGRAAHSARPWQGDNAIHRAGPLLAELLARPPADVRAGGLLFREAMSVTLASGGRARNVVPDRLELNLNYRFAPGRPLDSARREVLDFVAGRARVQFTDEAPAAPVCTDHPVLARLRERTGAPLEAKQAWTDVARLAAAGVPAANFGPGDPAQAHQQGEFARASSLAACLVALQRLLEREDPAAPPGV